MLLSATYIPDLSNDQILADLASLCTKHQININLPGNKSFNPRKPDLTTLVLDGFESNFINKCADRNAFFKFKVNER